MDCKWCGKSLVGHENLVPGYHNECLKRKLELKAKKALEDRDGPLRTVI